MEDYDVIIIGAGAAGLMCAIRAGARGRKVLLLEHNSRIGNKIRISGGGRCNFTNLDVSAENFISNNPHFAKSALSRFTPEDFIEMVQDHQIDFYEKKLGQLFCRESSSEIIEMLNNECRKSKVTIRTSTEVEQIIKEEGFECVTFDGDYRGESLVIATGGRSLPKMGATGFGYRIAEQFKLNLIPCSPGLVPLRFAPPDQHWSEIAGVSAPVQVKSDTGMFEDDLLVTHKGFSGPAILKISNYWDGESLKINWLPYLNLEEEIQRLKKAKAKQQVKNYLSQHLPKRLIAKLLKGPLLSREIKMISDFELSMLIEQCHHFDWNPSGDGGYKVAEVTKGGVDTNELSSKTFECRKVPGLYFIGEVLDVTGWLGGYNFQWAWASGHCAGQYV